MLLMLWIWVQRRPLSGVPRSQAIEKICPLLRVRIFWLRVRIFCGRDRRHPRGRSDPAFAINYLIKSICCARVGGPQAAIVVWPIAKMLKKGAPATKSMELAG